MFCADVLILERVRFLECRLDDSHKIGAHVEFCSTLRARQPANGGSEFLCERLKIDAQLLQNRQYNSVLLLNERPKKVFGHDLRIASFLRVRLRRLKGFLTLQSQFVLSNHESITSRLTLSPI